LEKYQYKNAPCPDYNCVRAVPSCQAIKGNTEQLFLSYCLPNSQKFLSKPSKSTEFLKNSTKSSKIHKIKLTDNEPKKIGHSKQMEVAEQSVNSQNAQQNFDKSNHVTGGLKQSKIS
jgi:hypothetical protein